MSTITLFAVFALARIRWIQAMPAPLCNSVGAVVLFGTSPEDNTGCTGKLGTQA
jgi:hypothetical protein